MQELIETVSEEMSLNDPKSHKEDQQILAAFWRKDTS